MADKVPFHVDLLQQTINHLSFLKTVYELKILHERPVVQSAIRRYEEMWLPLAADHPDECLSAPLDIEWAWHCHMLAPLKYAQTCQARFSVLINHTIRTGKDYETALLTSEKYWREKYPDDKDWFYFDKLGQALSFKNSKQTSLYFILASAMERQTAFYYQVSLPHFRDNKFLMGVLERYRKFLYLKSTLLPSEAVVPCFDIDLMWHTHQLNPAAYDVDTRGLLGYVLDHDDNVEVASKSGQLQSDTMATARHWQELFKEPFTRVGVDYRGLIHWSHFAKQQHHFLQLGIKVTNISFDDVHLFMSDFASGLDNDTLRVCIWRDIDVKFIGRVILVTKPESTRKDSYQVAFDRPLQFAPTSNKGKLELHIELIQTGHITCFKHDKSLGKAIILVDLSSRVYHLADGREFCEFGHLGPGMSIEMHGSVTTSLSDMSQLVFRLDEGRVTQEEVDSKTLLVLGIGADDNEKCLLAFHSLRYGPSGPILYQARVLHALTSGAFLVQIIQKDYGNDSQHEVAAVHLICPDQLPSPDQVEEDGGCTTLDPFRQERALLIKSRAGDWGIVTGAAALLTDKEQDTTENVSFEIDFWKLPSGQRTPCRVSKDFLHVRTPWVSVDLANGVVTMDAANVLEMGETLAFAFTVSLMNMMCIMDSKDPTIHESIHIPPGNPFEEDCTVSNVQIDSACAEELPHVPDWNMRKFFRACALGQSSLPNRCSSSENDLHLIETSGISARIYSYEYLNNIINGIEKQRRDEIARRKEEIERRGREMRREEDAAREREENHWRNVKHPAGMCLGCGPSGCRGFR